MENMQDLTIKNDEEAITSLKFSIAVKNQIISVKQLIKKNYGVTLKNPETLEVILKMIATKEFFESLKNVKIKELNANSNRNTFIISGETKQIYDNVIHLIGKCQLTRDSKEKVIIIDYNTNLKENQVNNYPMVTDEYMQIIIQLYRHKVLDMAQNQREKELDKEMKQILAPYTNN